MTTTGPATWLLSVGAVSRWAARGGGGRAAVATSVVAGNAALTSRCSAVNATTKAWSAPVCARASSSVASVRLERAVARQLPSTRRWLSSSSAEDGGAVAMARCHEILEEAKAAGIAPGKAHSEAEAALEQIVQLIVRHGESLDDGFNTSALHCAAELCDAMQLTTDVHELLSPAVALACRVIGAATAADEGGEGATAADGGEGAAASPPVSSRAVIAALRLCSSVTRFDAYDWAGFVEDGMDGHLITLLRSDSFEGKDEVNVAAMRLLATYLERGAQPYEGRPVIAMIVQQYLYTEAIFDGDREVTIAALRTLAAVFRLDERESIDPTQWDTSEIGVSVQHTLRTLRALQTDTEVVSAALAVLSNIRRACIGAGGLPEGAVVEHDFVLTVLDAMSGCKGLTPVDLNNGFSFILGLGNYTETETGRVDDFHARQLLRLLKSHLRIAEVQAFGALAVEALAKHNPVPFRRTGFVNHIDKVLMDYGGNMFVRNSVAYLNHTLGVNTHGTPHKFVSLPPGWDPTELVPGSVRRIQEDGYVTILAGDADGEPLEEMERLRNAVEAAKNGVLDATDYDLPFFDDPLVDTTIHVDAPPTDDDVPDLELLDEDPGGILALAHSNADRGWMEEAARPFPKGEGGELPPDIDTPIDAELWAGDMWRDVDMAVEEFNYHNKVKEMEDLAKEMVGAVEKLDEMGVGEGEESAEDQVAQMWKMRRALQHHPAGFPGNRGG